MTTPCAIGGVRPPILRVGAAVGFVVRHDVIAYAFEMLIDLRVESVMSRAAQVALIQTFRESSGCLLNE